MMEVCQHGWTHVQCRCPGPKEVKSIVCNIREHALNPKRPEPAPRPPRPLIAAVPEDVEEYFTGEISEDTLTKEVWETLSAALWALDNAYGDAGKIERARDWLSTQYGAWED